MEPLYDIDWNSSHFIPIKISTSVLVIAVIISKLFASIEVMF